MFLYNVHTSTKTFALKHKEGESYESLIDRIASKAGLENSQTKALKNRRDGGLVYEYQNEKYSLEDDDDLAILLDRLPPSSTSSTTLHLSTPSAADSHLHAHFAPNPPSYSSAANTVKSKAQRSQITSTTGQNTTTNSKSESQSNGSTGHSALKHSSPKSKSKSDSNSHSHSDSKDSAPAAPILELGAPINGSGNPNGGSATAHKSRTSSEKAKSDRGDESKSNNGNNSVYGNQTEIQTGEHDGDGHNVGLLKPARKARSVASNVSRKSRYGGDPNAESLADKHKREWEAFHAGSGVRTVVGEIAGVPNVRMLLKSGYKGVYISRTFATKHGLVSPKFGMGSHGYTGLKALGNVSITVGGKTALHPAMISEEHHFDVTLGRQWLEKVGVKVDPIDQTMLTYMDTGEVLSCDIVVLKDDKGNKIFVT